MLRTMISEAPFTQKWILHGRLCGQWAADLKERWEQARGARSGCQCIVDLEDVTAVDCLGESTLLEMALEGARFVASRAYMKSIIESLHVSRAS